MCFRYLTLNGNKISSYTGSGYFGKYLFWEVDMHVFAILLLKFLAIKTMC